MAVKIQPYIANQGLDIGAEPRAQFDTSGFVAGRSMGAALGSVGAAIGNIGTALDVVGERKRKLDEQRAAFAAGIADDERRQALATELDSSQKAMPVGGAGFHDGFMVRANKINQEYIKKIEGISPSLAAKYREKIGVETEQWSRNAGNIEYKVGRDFTNGKLQDVVNSHLNAIAANPDPANTDELKKGFRERIESAPYLSPAEKADVIRKVELQYLATEAQKRFRTEAEARGALNVPGRGIRSSGLTTTQRALLNAIAGPESGGRYNVRYTPAGGATFAMNGQHPRVYEPGPAGPSSAAGRYQFTWQEWKRTMGANTPFTPENQDKAALKLAEERYSKATGRDVYKDLEAGKVKEVLATLGPTWVGLKDNPQKALAAYNKTLQGASDKPAQGSVPAGSDGGSLADPRYAELPLDVKEKIIRQVASFEHGETAKLRAEVGRLANDANAAFLSGRTDFAGAPTQDTYIRAYGAEEGARRFKMQEDNRAVGEQVQQFRTMPSQEIAQAVMEAQNAPAGPGFTQDAARAKVLAQAAQSVLKARAADPAQYAAQHNPAVQEAYTAMVKSGADPVAMQRYADIAMQEQKRLGIAEPSLLPKAYVSAVAGDLTASIAAGNHADASKKMQAMQAAWGNHWSTVFGQIAKEGDLSGPMMVIGTMNRPEQAVASRLLMDAIVNQKEIVKTIDADAKKEADGAVFEAVKPFMDTLRLPNNSKVVTSFQNAVKLLAYQYIRTGETGDKAVRKAYEDVIGKRYVMTKDYRIPVEQADPGIIQDGLRNAKANIAQFGVAPPPSLFKGVTEDARQAQVNSALQREGRWHTLPDESGVVLLYSNGQPAMLPSGTPLVLTWQEARDAAQFTGPERAPVQTKPGQTVGKLPMVGGPRINITPPPGGL